MNRFVPVLLASGLAATWVGCGSAPDSSKPQASAEGTSASSAEVVLVTLDVPNMV